MKKVILLLFVVLSISNANSIIQEVNKVDFDRAVLDICIAEETYCKILTDKRINSYLRKYYKPALMSIAHIESNFKYKQGKIDRDDISIFQINKRIWNRKKLRKYNMDYSYWKIKHNVKISTEVALKIWLINIAQYISKTHKYPKSLAEYISLYHRIDRISKNYKYKIKKVVYKYIRKI